MKRLTFLLPRLIVAGILCCLFAAPSVFTVYAAPALHLPSGFTDTVVVGGLLGARDFVFLPDDRILILERGNLTTNNLSGDYASLRVYDPAQQPSLLPDAALVLDTCGNSERGAVGITIDPNFNSNGYVYIYYSRPTTLHNCPEQTYQVLNRVSRFTMVGNTINPNTELVLIDNIVSYWGYHNAGDLNFDSNGYLYISVGNGGDSPDPSPDTDRLNGKILRIKPVSTATDPRGYITTGNPYESASGARTCGTPTPAADPNPGTINSNPCREVYAYGFRNPFRFTIMPSMAGIPGAGQPVLGDVGSNAWEEVNLVYPEQNQDHRHGYYGWPEREGPCTYGTICVPPPPENLPPQYTDPIYSYSHLNGGSDQDSAVIGGPFYTGTSYPAQYQKSYFFADYVRGFIGQLKYSNGKWTPAAQYFATGGLGIIGLQVGPGSARWGTDLYYVNKPDETDSTRTSELRRIRYTSGNTPPVAIISVDAPNDPSPSHVYTFSAAGSYDPDRNLPLRYQWDFGDGSSQDTTVPTAQHVYSDNQNRTVSLTVVDSKGATSVPATLTVYPQNTAPIGSIVLTNQTAAQRDHYYAGDGWQYQAQNVTDAQDGALPASSIQWSVVFHHQTHTHPFLSNLPAGLGGTFNIPPGNEPDPVQWYRVHMKITDSRGQSVDITRDIFPATATITLMTFPPGGKILFEDGPRQTPFTVTRVINFQLPIDAADPQTIGGVSQPFAGWSIGGPKSQIFNMPATATTLTAFYGPPARNYSTTQPTLTWSPISWARGYHIQISTSSTFTPASTIVVDDNTLTSAAAQYTTVGLPKGPVYYWHVRAKNDAGLWGPWSSTEMFVIGP
jgi:glucose/arabinose dehydrogenase/PKD repeat protein